MLVGLPRDFRATWNKTGTRIVSEHDRFVADVYADHSNAYIEDLFAGDAGAGLYLIERSDAGLRFAVADLRGAAMADSALDAGASVEACVRCHANARDGIYPVVP
jgi:cytochrome c553